MKTLKTEEETASHLILDLSMQIQGASFGRCAQTSDKKGFAKELLLLLVGFTLSHTKTNKL